MTKCHVLLALFALHCNLADLLGLKAIISKIVICWTKDYLSVKTVRPVVTLLSWDDLSMKFISFRHCYIHPSNLDMHPTATEKLPICLTLNNGVMFSAAHAVNTLYNILQTALP